MNTFKILTGLVLAVSAMTMTYAHAADVTEALSIKTCTRNSADCADPNGPSLDGLASRTPSIKSPLGELFAAR